MAELHERLAGSALGRSKADFFEHFRRLERGGQHLDEEVGGLDHALTLAAGSHDLRIQGDHRCRPVSGGIGMRQAAADRALVAHLHVAKMRGRLREQRAGAVQQVRGLNLKMRGGRPNSDLAALFANVSQVLDASDIDQHFRLRQPQLHCREKAVSAGQKFGVVFMLGQQAKRLVQALGGDVVKTRRNHDLLLLTQLRLCSC